MDVVILVFYYNNSGMLNADGHFSYKEIPYRGDSALTDGRDHGVDLIGGYYQGSKLIVNGCLSHQIILNI